MNVDSRFSVDIARHLESDSDFERDLYTEVVRRVSYGRRAGSVVKTTKWYDWLAPAISAATIVTVYYLYIFPRF